MFIFKELLVVLKLKKTPSTLSSRASKTVYNKIFEPPVLFYSCHLISTDVLVMFETYIPITSPGIVDTLTESLEIREAGPTPTSLMA